MIATAEFIASREVGLARLAAFTPIAGQHYSSARNYDRGPGQHNSVSQLSPYLRRRLVTEEEAVMAAVRGHGLAGAEKFNQEVFWRTYFKGWLEQRPVIWDLYRDGLQADLDRLENDRDFRKRLDRALAGETRIECFDFWVKELLETGYLHNHARMWFASIWIFTLELPWRLGADFFLRNLIDGDPASNTLSWRWIAGLHTRGKTYQAEAWNIAKFTDQRFIPVEGKLSPVADALVNEEPNGLPPIAAIRKPVLPDQHFSTGLLITEEECRIEALPLSDFNIKTVATLGASHLRSTLPVNTIVRGFELAALADTVERLGCSAQELIANDPKVLLNWAKEANVSQILTGYIPVGPLRDWMKLAQSHLDAEGVSLCEWQREWDALIWPYATAGFFKVKKQIPRILQQLGMPDC
ncbi:FAD-binding domain-containing protein [Hoeflea sp. AS60]|uniref:FAD-binding domain-containing protein n=1 Tax=Hoeflea sp. AS60 TaxID=3135780 RepID=UPI0031774F44